MEEHENRPGPRLPVSAAWAICRSGWRSLVAALVLVSPIGLAACTGSPATLALRPAFEVESPNGIASVSVRGSWPGMTDSEFVQLVKAGMARAASGSVISGPVDAPFPERRIVWHVNPGIGRGVSVLMVNIFDGSVPVSYKQEVVANDASAATIEATIELLTTRLIGS